MAKEEDLQAALAQMQLLQQRAQVFASQKQQFQIQLMEAEDNFIPPVSNFIKGLRLALDESSEEKL